MGNPVLIVGESGVGKTYSIKTLDPEKTAIFLCEKSRLPFREKFNTYYVRNMKRVDDNNKEQIIRQSIVIQTVLRNPKDPKKIYVIDDSQYLMANEFFDRANESGYQKFTDIGKNFRDLIHLVNDELPDDVIVYFLHHPETDQNTGKIKAKTIGRMLDDQLTIEGMFPIVLLADCDDSGYHFVTKSDGTTPVKAPIGMFEEDKIPNDLALVDAMIRDYWQMRPLMDDE